MTTYELYLESGPRRRKTMVHVLDLRGRVAAGRTTSYTSTRIRAGMRLAACMSSRPSPLSLARAFHYPPVGGMTSGDTGAREPKEEEESTRR